MYPSDFSIANGGKYDVSTHVKGKQHNDKAMACASSSESIRYFFTPQDSSADINAEALWATFVVEHNHSFKESDHATKLFQKMFPDYGVAKIFACGRTKTSDIITEAMTPYHDGQMLGNLDKNCLFSVMMDESNDKTNKSCINLIWIFDYDARDFRTKFIDMPVVNIGTAVNLFNALKAFSH